MDSLEAARKARAAHPYFITPDTTSSQAIRVVSSPRKKLFQTRARLCIRVKFSHHPRGESRSSNGARKAGLSFNMTRFRFHESVSSCTSTHVEEKSARNRFFPLKP
jgi:hypothetical protein